MDGDIEALEVHPVLAHAGPQVGVARAELGAVGVTRAPRGVHHDLALQVAGHLGCCTGSRK